MIIAIRAAAVIISDYTRTEDSDSNSVNAPPPATSVPVYPAFAPKTFTRGALDPYMPSLCEFISQLMHSLDSTFGNLLLHNQTKPISGMSCSTCTHWNLSWRLIGQSSSSPTNQPTNSSCAAPLLQQI
jgi:hypothetical protein